MSTDVGPPSLSVPPEEITAHAGTVDELATRSARCAAAVHYLRLDTGAYGQLCGFVPALLNGVTTNIEVTSTDAYGALRDAADGLRQLVPHFTAADDAAGRFDPNAAASLPNALIAPRIDSTTWFSGIGIFETFDQLIAGIQGGTWIDVTLAGVGTVAEAVAWGLDPIGMLIAAGFGFAVEHVSFLSDALDWLAGDPDQVNAHAQTWRNAAAEQTILAEEYRRSVEVELGSWAGVTADAYRARAGETADMLAALAKSYETMSVVITGAGTLVALVRTLVRDLIAQCISLLLYRIPAWSAMEVGTLGLATAYVAAQISALVARFSTQIARLLHALVSSLSRLSTSARQLDDLIATIQELLRRRRGGAPTYPSTHPNVHFGPLGTKFQPGVVETNNPFLPKERDIADYFAERGVHVESVKPVDNIDNFTNPDSIFRRSPDDPGRLTEMKTLSSGSSSTVRDRITDAGAQLGPHGGGDVVIDGRAAGLTEAEARRGYARAFGQTAQQQTYMPETVYFILGDGSLLTLPDR